MLEKIEKSEIGVYLMLHFEQNILNQINESVIICNQNHEIVFVNDTAKNVLGDLIYSLNEAGESTQDVLKYKDDGVTLFALEELPIIRALNGESLKDLEMLIVYQGQLDKHLWCSINASPIYEDSKVVSALITIRDLTERKKFLYNIQLLNGKLSQTNNLLNLNIKELEGFAARVAHDLKAPLTPITGFMDMLKDEFSQDEDKVQMIDIILKSTYSMSTLINELLEFSHISSEHDSAEEVDITVIFNEVESLIQTSLIQVNGSIRVSKLPRVICNKVPVKHLLSNILSNSIKYSKDDMKLLIDVEYTPPKLGKDFATLTIIDNGIGFKQEEADLIFEPMTRLQTNKAKGHGLGLAISAKAAIKEGWSISAASSPNEGATFTILIPKEKIINS